jgi:hypothetical protein
MQYRNCEMGSREPDRKACRRAQRRVSVEGLNTKTVDGIYYLEVANRFGFIWYVRNL